MSYLQGLVIERCRESGIEAAAAYFEVSPSLVRQWLAGSKTPSLAAVEKVFTLPEGAVQNAAWEGKEVVIGLPQYKSTTPLTLFALLGIWDRSKFGAILKYNDAFIAHSRNSIAKQFLDTGKEWLWWVDDDIVFPLGNAAWFNVHTGLNLPDKFAGLHTPTKLRSHNKSIVSGLYFGRKEGGRAVYAEALQESQAGNAENDYAKKAPIDELRPVSWSGAGCLLTHRQVYLDIQNKFPHLAAQHPSEPFHFFSNASDGVMQVFEELKAKVHEAQALLVRDEKPTAISLLTDLARQMESAQRQTVVESRLQQGEDATFGKRAKAAGHQTYVDLAVRCGHIGPKVF